MNELLSIRSAVEDLFGPDVRIEKRRPVSGGDINSAYALDLSNAETLFLKMNDKRNIGFFRAEAEGLHVMKVTGTVRVPEVLALGTDGERSFLLLEYIEEGRGGKDSSEELGRELALMHLSETGSFVRDGTFGFLHDNYIGAGIQINTPKDRWIEFFAQCRLLPQYQKARHYFEPEERARFESFLGKIDQYLTEPVKPSLLHGDLWAGNYMIDRDGNPWLIDPAASVGHAEADLAMTELFGGFGRSFYEAYKETAGLDPGYQDRKDLYNLYHLLNHLNLFGGSYLHSVKSILRRYI